MHVLVTGAGGFSGVEVVKQLLAEEHRVTAVTGTTGGRSRDLPAQNANLRLIRGDLAGEIALPSSLDAIVHTAARSPQPGVTDEQIVRDNLVATQKLVMHAKYANVRSFIFFSSLSVHGRIETPVVDETTPIVDPDTYGLTKLQCEELLAAESRHFRSLAIRLPGVIGRNSVRNWLTGVLAAARDGREISIYNPTAKYNNAVHVADLAQFVCNLLQKDWAIADAVPIGASGETTVIQAVHLIADAFGGRSMIRIAQTPAKPAFIISSARARECYGYQAMEIRTMLRRFAEENGGCAIYSSVV